MPVSAVALPAAVAVGLAVASLVLPRVPWWPALRDPEQPWVLLLDVRDEGSVHTWWNVVLLGAAAVLAVGAALVRRAAGREGWPWWLVSAVLAALSLDDVLAVHERLEPLGEQLGGGSGALHFAWVVPGAVAGLVAVVLVVVAARRLPREAATPLAGGLVLLLVAALGLEAVGGAVLDTVGDGAVYILVSHLEELLESLAACLLLLGAARGLRWGLPADDRIVTEA